MCKELYLTTITLQYISLYPPLPYPNSNHLPNQAYALVAAIGWPYPCIFKLRPKPEVYRGIYVSATP